MFYTTFFKFLKYFGKGHEKQICLMAIYTALTSFFEFASVAIILPFIIVLISPGTMNNNFFIRAAREIFNLPTDIDVLKFSALVLIAMILAKNIYGIFIMYWQNKLLKEWALDIKQMFMRMYLYAPFEMNVREGDSDRFFNISQDVDNVFNNFVFRVIVFTTNTIVVGMIFTWIICLLPKYTILAALFFTVSASLQNRLIFRQAKLYADDKYKLTTGVYDVLMKSLRCLKEIKITSSENFFYKVYKKLSAKLVPLEEKINLLPIIPQYVIEMIFVFTIIILFVGIFKEYGINREEVLISLGIVCISLFRILPLMNKSQVCINYIDMYREYPPKIFELYDSFKAYENYYYEPDKTRIPFNDSIRVENLSYSYDKENPVLDDINFTVKKGEYIGIIGVSGAGKTTLTDCLTGLLIGEGNIYIDDNVLTYENIKQYQNIIGYVTQNTNTIAGDLKTNVAWGIPEDEVDDEKVTEALKFANLYDQLTESSSRTGTVINPDGTGLSQGQIQRIGIARAFYRNPELLIFDEATSSLDVNTENEIIEILEKKKGDITMIAVSHRLSTLKMCDRIIYMSEGKIVDIGSFWELSEKYEEFAKFLENSSL
ncbi:MAG: ABC transporter ATP-binding protein/permease [Candidatus Gastranaerophilales bacterium]|nr:ABC transporter ATP-binding protein/permease [Candidatus Gastranaerophilales bacterium]